MKERNKNFLQSEDAQSTVIGAVLVIGILIVASTSYFASHIPDWTKDYEALHTANVADDFSELKTLIDGIVLKKGESELAGGAIPVKMAPDKVPILGMSPPGSSLNFLPDTEIFKITPAVTGGPTPPSPVNYFWEETTTADFMNADAVRVKVDVTSDEIKLSKLSTHGDLILDGTAAIRGDEYYYDRVEIVNGGTLYVAPCQFLKIYANQITIDSTSKIFADGRGYLGGDGGTIGSGMGYGNPGYTGGGGGGAGYGGDGGNGGLGGDITSEAGAGGDSYSDDTSSVIEFGSGGGGGGYGEGAAGTPFVGANGGDGGNGGGAILLSAEKITIAGTISADGSHGRNGAESSGKAGGGGGGGSGGTIIIRGRDVSISGTLSAKGGLGGAGGNGSTGNADSGGGAGGGAGGRIKVFYENTSLYTSTSYSHPVDGGAGGAGGAGGKNAGENGVSGSSGSFYESGTTYISSVPHYSFGYYVSRVYDTENTTTCYGEMTWSAVSDEYTSIVMKARTSMSSVMDGNATLWENCPAVANGQDISDLSSAFDGHRYIQYRAELYTYEATMTPELYSVRINYSSSNPVGGSPTVEEASGIIKFKSNYLYYPNQEIVYEHGAVIKYQREGGFMLHPPPINITSESGIPTIEISMIDLTGTKFSYAGATTTSVENFYNDYDSFSNKFDNLTLNLTTEYPSIWDKWFNRELEKTTLTTPYDYNVSVNATAKTVSVEFYGHEHGVQLYLEKTVVEVEI